VVSPSVWYTKQTVGNACGTVGLLHTIANNTELLSIGMEALA
jgi:ubiquitin carboxyl-terminal hydrolase L3